MMIRWPRFNIYFTLAAVLVAVCGCKSPEHSRQKALSTLKLYLETDPYMSKRTQLVPVHRDPQIMINIENNAFLDETYMKDAKVVDVMGGYALRLEFNRLGSRILEQYSGGHRSAHFAIFSQFCEPPDYKLNKGRWLGAPKITQHIADGVLVFTPDATKEETEMVALGLRNVAKKLPKEGLSW